MKKSDSEEIKQLTRELRIRMGENLKWAEKEHQLEDYLLEEALGIYPASLSAKKRGVRSISNLDIFRLCSILSITPNEVFLGKDHESIARKCSLSIGGANNTIDDIYISARIITDAVLSILEPYSPRKRRDIVWIVMKFITNLPLDSENL